MARHFCHQGNDAHHATYDLITNEEIMMMMMMT